ncbi:MAG: TetR/AcrR family transcriptional regulator [Bacteroidetes bacterium]|nr:TetR/AcrR family transcriptional regulator [Bacteroidota bacterium]
MGRRPVKKFRREDDEVKLQWLSVIAPKLFQEGFRHLSMDEIILWVGVSKATFYKYFSSREMLVEEMLTLKLTEITGFKDILFEFGRPYRDRYRASMVLLEDALAPVSPKFLEDVMHSHPEQLNQVYQFIEFSLQWLEQFYMEGMRDHGLRKVNPKLLLMADGAFLTSLVSTQRLKKTGLSVGEALHQYFELRALGLQSVSKTKDLNLS